MKEVDSVPETFEDHVVEGSSHEKPSPSPLFSKNLREYRWRVVRLFTLSKVSPLPTNTPP